jgi:hypothetical protein
MTPRDMPTATRTVPRIAVAEVAARPGGFDDLDHPLIIEGAIDHWPALARWGAAYLKNVVGSIEIPFKQSTTHQHPDFHQRTLAQIFARKQSSFASFVDAITVGPVEDRARFLFTGDEKFLWRRRDGQITEDPQLAPLLRDLDVPTLIPEAQLYTIWAWFSGKGVRTWLHYDNNGCHNLNAQVTGTKECLLIAPDDLPGIYPYLLGGSNPAHNCSQVDVDAPDLERFPAFAQVPGWRAEIRAGDLLFIPAWWFHAFLHHGDFNSNVNFWWKPTRPAMNPVAARQALLDLVTSAGVDLRAASAERTLLERLDQTATAGKSARPPG